MTTFALQVAVVILHAMMIGFTHRVKYNKIVNPYILFIPLLIVQWVVLRVGVINTYFSPNALDGRA